MIAAVPCEAGAFATGAMTGDRSAISLDTVQALRDSNLAHLLAISGMNMAFITGFVFALVRYGLALMPAVALRVNYEKGGRGGGLWRGAVLSAAVGRECGDGAGVSDGRA